jgi:hypothetical protein
MIAPSSPIPALRSINASDHSNPSSQPSRRKETAVSHELRIIRIDKQELLFYCTAGDFTWEFYPKHDDDLAFPLDQYRKHLPLEHGTATLCPECLTPIRFTRTP